MAVAALDSVEIAQINRVLESFPLHGHDLHSASGLVENGMAGITIIPHDFTFCTNMLPIVTAEAAIEVIMAQIVWVSSPIHLHFREDVSRENSLYLDDSSFDRSLKLRILGRIIVPVISFEIGGNRLQRFFRSGVRFAQDLNCLLLDKGQ